MKIYMMEDVLKIRSTIFYSENKRKEEVRDTSLEPEDIYFWRGGFAFNVKCNQETFEIFFSFLN